MKLSLARLRNKHIIAAAGILILAAAIVFVVEAIFAGLALKAAKTDGAALAARLSAGDITGAEHAAKKLETDAHRAHLFTVGPLWWIGAHVPLVGNNVSAVQDTASALNVMSNQGIPVLLNVANEAKDGALRLQNGHLSTDAIASFAPQLRRAADAIDPAADRVARIHTGALVPPLNSLMAQVQKRVAEAKTSIDTAADAFQVLPSVLGADGPRTYLLVIQNPAEIRATGGLIGTLAFLRADQGKLSMVGTATGESYRTAAPPMQATTEETNLFGSDWGTDIRSVTFTPDFPRAAQMAAAMAAAHGTPVNAVFAVDPIALSYVLRGTGPVTVEPGTVLTANNVVSTLLNKIYLTLPNQAEQNAFYAKAAQQVFQTLIHGSGNQLQAIRGLVEGVTHHRVFAWSSDPALAKVIGHDSLSGAFPTDTGKTPQVGVFLNDAVAGKPEYYLKQSSTVTASSCKDGVQVLHLVSHFSSTMPADAATRFTYWVVGPGTFAPKGDILDELYIAGPWRGTVDTLTLNGSPVTVTADQLDGRQMASTVLQLKPGESVTLEATMHTGPGQTGTGILTWTPGMSTETNPSSFASACH